MLPNGLARWIEKTGLAGVCTMLLWALLVRVPDALDKQGDKMAEVVKALNKENQNLLRTLMDENRLGRDLAVQKVIEETRRDRK